MKLQGYWIWTSEDVPERNAFVRFRRTFCYEGGPALLHITADSRYMLYINGEYVGQGPVRAWPHHWRYDTYDIQPLLNSGDNQIAVLVNHFGEGNFQYIPGPPGLLAEIQLTDGKLVTDSSWRVSPDTCFVSATPRISLQQGFEEQFDSRNLDDWVDLSYDDSKWPYAYETRPAGDGFHKNLEPRGIPFLTLEPVLPKRVLNKETVRSISYRFTLYPKPYIAPSDFSSNALYGHAYIVTQIWAPEAVQIMWLQPAHKIRIPFKLNGHLMEHDVSVRLRAGWNSVIGELRGTLHGNEISLCIEGPPGLRFCAVGEEEGAQWAVVGPFGFDSEDRQRIAGHADESLVVCEPLCPEALLEVGNRFWQKADIALVVGQPFFQQMRSEHLLSTDVFVQAYTDKVVSSNVRIENEEAFFSGSDWVIIHPDSKGNDVRILLDFGEEVVGFHRFEVDAPAGTILDNYNFEFMHPNGRIDLAEGMNNSFRFICRGGRQIYQTYVRRGFRYSFLVIRGMSAPVKLRGVKVIFNSYPQARRGSFACSDAMLNRIWEVGAHTLRCCAEDTYVDCPAYEQTHWVGDARNEALVDWVVNGDSRLWFRCLEQTGDSLDRSSITESEVPSAWQNLLPAWSFLWMRSCREYLLFTGDERGSRRLLKRLEQNVEGVLRHLNSQGLFEIRAWNMFDWAPMDTPSIGVVTHQNCLAVHTIRDAAEMAVWLGERKLAIRWRAIADDLARAINQYLWNNRRRAYTDCMRDGVHSKVYSQQTQTVALTSGVAVGERAERCKQILHDPPRGFVRAGSPFFEFFLLEAYRDEGREQDILDTIRRDWGFMINMGATTFWETWPPGGIASGGSEAGRLTRSYCHGWSAAPTYFLSTYVLGARPGGVGFSPVVIEPHPGNLLWCRGTVPTPLGELDIRWENLPGKNFLLYFSAPKELKVKVKLPRKGVSVRI